MNSNDPLSRKANGKPLVNRKNASRQKRSVLTLTFGAVARYIYLVTTPPFHSDSKIIANRQLPRLATWVAIFSILFRCPSSLEACDETAPRVCKPYFRIKGAVLSRILPYCLGYLPTRTAKDVYLFNISQLVFLTAAIIFVHLWLRRRPSTTRTSHQHDHASKRPPPATEESPRNRAPFEVLYPDPDKDTTPAEVDIIAVHGFGSSVDWSWNWRDKTSPGTLVNWLKDPCMLPEVVPKSRIMVYNYQSRCGANGLRTKLQLSGEDLVRSLHAFRKGLQNRPVVFVGHSFGGLVIQHALLYAEREDQFRYLPRCTDGFIALGSPFQGIRMPGVRNFVSRLMLLVDSLRGLLETFGYDDQILRNKLKEFCELQKSRSIPICCFFEAHDTDYGSRLGLPGLLHGMVVTKESACVPGWKCTQVETDHLNLIKFSGPCDQSFLRVSKQILKMCSASTSGTDDRTKKIYETQIDESSLDLVEGHSRVFPDPEAPSRQQNPPRDESVPRPAEKPIQILHDDSNANIDIVAVHGLAANPDYAWVWQPKNNPPGCPGYPTKHFNWLGELLPLELSSKQVSCRVMTFNYDSKWFMNAPQQRLSNISDKLLASLRNMRDKVTGRPLIFIGHSFGGNVIEQAIVSASRQSDFAEIGESTVGVVFLGTPHRGCAAASWGAMITSLAPPQFDCEDRILKDLEENSSALADRLHDFSRWLFVESVPVVCFFEQLVTDLASRLGPLRRFMSWRELIVPEKTACIDGHHKISLEADHFKINKFYGPNDPSFKLVYPEIERMARGAQGMLKHRRHPKAIPKDEGATSGDLRTCLQEMRVTNPLDILSDIRSQKGTRIGHTCEWILKREEFSAWGANDNSRLLCLIGSPGIGKTMMSTFLIETLQGKIEKSPGKTIAYFLFDDKNQERRTPTAMLRSLIWQLLLQRNELFQHIQPDFKKHKNSHLYECLFENLSALWRIFKEMLQDKDTGEIFILIDGLDQCDRSGRQVLLRCIAELFQKSPKSAGNLKFLVTCRPEVGDIEYMLGGIGVSLRMGSTEVREDLTDFINFKVEELSRRNKYGSSLQTEVREALLNQAEGTFLWVSLVIDELESTPKYEVASKLYDLPKGLDGIYTRMLGNIPGERQNDVRFLLSSMVAARRPLTKKELAASFAFWKTSLVVGDQDLHDFMDIFSSCSSIICFDVIGNNNDSATNLCHQSARDFLLNDHGGSSRTWYHMSLDSANLLMFQICWRYLSDLFSNDSLVTSRWNDIPTEARRRELLSHLRQHCFFSYAFSEWEDHAIASYPAIQNELPVDIVRAPILRDIWLLRMAREGHRHDVIIKMLLTSEGVYVNPKDKDGRTPLSWAAGNGHESIVKMLLTTNEVDINSKDSDGHTPLWWAAVNGHEAIVKLLRVAENGSLDLINGEHGRTPAASPEEYWGSLVTPEKTPSSTFANLICAIFNHFSHTTADMLQPHELCEFMHAAGWSPQEFPPIQVLLSGHPAPWNALHQCDAFITSCYRFFPLDHRMGTRDLGVSPTIQRHEGRIRRRDQFMLGVVRSLVPVVPGGMPLLTRRGFEQYFIFMALGGPNDLFFRLNHLLGALAPHLQDPRTGRPFESHIPRSCFPPAPCPGEQQWRVMMETQARLWQEQSPDR
ncbi:hypothetical protein FOTG_11726 [Fusarium oxysporum f. sp. vasinfectum 25433]|uniref:NACHT domain-containing protein n=1 Tax=Fusarium oxysporum f. sp. vasinfectum 25433 TaxID=1089449 RepID=X0MIH8_FUSOX|nr:hypothetical protein FOTG_11726 [Fusarium oxysporum f. sp. vasinfectum 25433]